MGTVYYMAPEQLLRSLDVDHRADIYSLRVVFYEMLTGELPVGRFAPPGQRARVDPRLDAIVLRALESKPEHRYQDAAEIKRDVEAILAWPEVPATERTDWPCVRFTIPDVSWIGAHVDGEMYRDETTLILDFSVVSPLGSSTLKEVRVPLAELLSISLHEDPPGWPGAQSNREIVLKAASRAALAELPAGQHGRGRLLVHPGDLEAAQQLVDSILRSPHLASPRPHPGLDPGPPREPELAAPVAGKLLSWWRSFAGYFVSISGTRARRRRGGERQNDG
jgi:serine/threonine protein kinase